MEVILDKSQKRKKYSPADFLAHAGTPMKIDAAHAIAHNKVMIIDGETIITGSFNFTRAAEDKNAESLLIIKGKTLAENIPKTGRITEDTAKFILVDKDKKYYFDRVRLNLADNIKCGINFFLKSMNDISIKRCTFLPVMNKENPHQFGKDGF